MRYPSLINISLNRLNHIVFGIALQNENLREDFYTGKKRRTRRENRFVPFSRIWSNTKTGNGWVLKLPVRRAWATCIVYFPMLHLYLSSVSHCPTYGRC